MEEGGAGRFSARRDIRVGRSEDFPREEDIDTTPGVWATPPHPRRDIGGRIIPRGEAEFRRSLRAESPGTREEWSDETEEMDTDTPRELEGDNETSAVEITEDRDVQEEPEAWD